MRRLIVLGLTVAGLLGAADKYEGPRPDKPDVPYIKHASKLIPLETGEMRDEGGKKDQSVMTMAGANSPTRTPLAEPLFLFQSEKLDPARLELYKVETKNGRREIVLKKKGFGGSRPFRIMVNPLGEKLYRIDVNETLENGQYCLSPGGDNRVFCFEVY